jgi:hypothetical protein
VVEEAESGGDVSYAKVMGCLLDFGGAAGAAGFDDGGHAARGGVADVVAEREGSRRRPRRRVSRVAQLSLQAVSS